MRSPSASPHGSPSPSRRGLGPAREPPTSKSSAVASGFILGAVWAVVVFSLLSNSPLAALQRRADAAEYADNIGGRRGLMEGARPDPLSNAAAALYAATPSADDATAAARAATEHLADAAGSGVDPASAAAQQNQQEISAASAAAGGGSAAGSGADGQPRVLPPRPEVPLTEALRVPWPPLLTAEEVQRGLAYYGSGQRLERMAAKLLAGKPIKVYALGGSVTKGQGTSTPEAGYVHQLFDFITHNFPNKHHQLVNKGVGATSSGIFAACAEQMVSADADLVIVELTINEHPDEPYIGKQRQGYEQLLRKLMKLPSKPAVVQVHHYAWWRAEGDGVEAGLFYSPAAEAQLTVMSQYYDIPALSLRSAIFPLMQAGVPGFKPEKVWNAGQVTMSGDKPIPVADMDDRPHYFYYDRSHPNDHGHRVIAELLAALIMRAAEREESVSCAPGRWAAQRSEPELKELPPPMVPGNADAPTTLCAMQEDFKKVVVEAGAGFQYKAERPHETTFVGQKWGWTADVPGAWADLEFDSRKDATKQASKGNWASVYLSHLKSYEGMGTARVVCVSGCACEKTQLDGTWEEQATLMQVHGFKVTQHERCRVRVTVSKKAGVVPQEGHKVTLMAIMVSHFPLRLDTFDRTAEEVANSVTSGTDTSSSVGLNVGRPGSGASGGSAGNSGSGGRASASSGSGGTTPERKRTTAKA